MSDPNLTPERGQALRQLLDQSASPSAGDRAVKAQGAGETEAPDQASNYAETPATASADKSMASTASAPGRESVRQLLSRDSVVGLNASARRRLSPYKRKTLRIWQRFNPRNVMARLWRRDEELDRRFATMELLRSEVLSMGLRIDALGAAGLDHKITELATNLELIKGEVRGVSERIEQLGFAIAPGAGLVGASPRMAELRERVNAIDRRVRQLAQTNAKVSTATAEIREIAHNSHADDAIDSRLDGEETSGGSGFDYVGFEQRFRGDPAVILEIVRQRYLELLRPHQPVLDVGCGRGELLQMLADEGIAAVGVDLDSGMAAEAKARGLDAHHGDAIEYLRRQDQASLGAIISTHVVEHLELNDLVEFLELSVSRLRPGGLFIAETPNPATLLVLGNSYIMDPTHVWPLHPSLFTFLCERAGFRSVELLYGAPATDYQLDLVPTEGETAGVAEAINPALERLNQVLFGPQEYAVIARTPE